jgi:hypothetical protein
MERRDADRMIASRASVQIAQGGQFIPDGKSTVRHCESEAAFVCFLVGVSRLSREAKAGEMLADETRQ